ncbi:MAG: hypothetical protein GX658_02525, partial [Clostridiales bacterium]|nr:hypothetical protein [Clostridiales bacterium]
VKCEGILKEATAQATTIKADAAAASKKDADKVLAKAAKQAQAIVEMAKSGSAMEQKNALLDAKVGIIDEAVSYAKTKLAGTGDSEYFDIVLKLVKAYAQDSEGIMYFSQKDLSRLPADFAEKVSALTGGKLKVSSEPKNIDGGFILAYGDIEINCSFDALISEKLDGIKDTLNKIIFA